MQSNSGDDGLAAAGSKLKSDGSIVRGGGIDFLQQCATGLDFNVLQNDGAIEQDIKAACSGCCDGQA